MLPKLHLLQKLVESGVIAILRGIPADEAEPVADSLVAGGITALEMTLDSPNALGLIEKLSQKYAGKTVVGAGTVIDSESARMAIQHGADFLFSPSLHQEVIRTALRYGKIAIPGVMTPTEMIHALEWGADVVKLFPAAQLDVKYIKDVKTPFPHIPIIPTGGVSLDNVAAFFEAGVAAVGIGGNLLDKEAIASRDYAKLQYTASLYVEKIKEARSVSNHPQRNLLE